MLIRSSPTWIATPEHPLFCTIKETRYPKGYPLSVKTTHQVHTLALRTEYTKERKNEHTLVYQLECTFVEQPQPQILTLSEEDDCIFSVLDNSANPHPILTTLPQVSQISCVAVEGDLLPLYTTTPYPLQLLSRLFHQTTQHPLSIQELYFRIQRLVEQLTVQQLNC